MADSVGPVFLRDFWQNYPKDIEVGPTGATIWLMPSLKPDEYDWAKGKVEAHKLFYWFDSAATGGQAGGYKMRQGMTKTHEVWLASMAAARRWIGRCSQSRPRRGTRARARWVSSPWPIRSARLFGTMTRR
jgi:hypothetical protein